MKTLLTRPQKKSIKDAYDIKKARKDCQVKGFQAQGAYACMIDGCIQLIFAKTPPKSSDGLQSAVALCRQWLEGSNFKELLLRQARFPTISNPPRFVRCVVWSNGCGWNICDEDTVCNKLRQRPKHAGGNRQDNTIKGSIIDRSLIYNAISAYGNLPVADRVMMFAKSVLMKTALLHVQAEQIIDGFLEAYQKLDHQFRNNATQLAILIRGAKNAALRQMEDSLDLATPELLREQDEATALQQGFHMGRWVAQAEAIIANARSARLAATAGAGKPPSKLWQWINSDAKFAGKSAKEVWPLLHGCNDPDHPGKKLKLQEKRLQRGNGDWLKITSFTATFKKH